MLKRNFKIDELTLIMIVVFIALIIGMYNKIEKPKTFEAEKIAQIIFDNRKISFATNGIVDENKLRNIQGMSYDSFKKSLSIDNDFCILLEDLDGNVLLAKGSLKLKGDGIYCRE